MEIVTPEARAWLRAADTAGVELPAEVAEARDNMTRLEAELAALPQVEKPPTAAQLAASGLSLDKATAEHERLTMEMARRKSVLDSASPAIRLARGRLSRLVAEQRDDLIVGIRPTLTALVDEARPLAHELAAFAPKYDAEAIARKATPKQLKAFQNAVELETKFGALMAAWRSSFKAANAPGGFASPSKVPGFDVRWVDQVHRYWERPEHVANPRLNGTYLGKRGYPVAIEPTVLSVACEPEAAGLRLCTVRELKDAFETERLAKVEEARALVRQQRGGRAMSI